MQYSDFFSADCVDSVATNYLPITSVPMWMASNMRSCSLEQKVTTWPSDCSSLARSLSILAYTMCCSAPWRRVAETRRRRRHDPCRVTYEGFMINFSDTTGWEKNHGQINDVFHKFPKMLN